MVTGFGDDVVVLVVGGDSSVTPVELVGGSTIFVSTVWVVDVDGE